MPSSSDAPESEPVEPPASSRNPGALKCLHAHVAFALAQPGYRLGEAVLDEVPERWPERCCSLV